MVPTIAVIDGDILAYRAAFWADSEGPEWLEDRIRDDLIRWTPPGVDKIYVALSCKRDENFRRDFYSEYKAKRDDRPSPETLPDAMSFLLENTEVIRIPRLEADDIIGMWQSRGEAIGVTIDKDLKQIPGYSWYPKLDDDTEIKEIEHTDLDKADWFFHRQWITGDSTDNVPGIWKMGPKKAEALLNATTPDKYTELVLSLYETRLNKEGNNYTPDDAMAMARAVRILRNGEDTNPWMPRVATDVSKKESENETKD